MRKILGIILAVVLFTACKFIGTGKKALPIYGNREVVKKIADGKTVTDTIYQTIPAFKFINQYGDSITNKNLDGKIYVADFFFTTCPSICPVMHHNMLNVYNAFKDLSDFRIISYTIDPKHDSVNVLKNYADKLDIKGNTWWLLQGKKEETYKLADSYLVTKPTEVANTHIHDGFFILIDKQKRIRGSYDGTDPKQVEQLIEDIKTLKAEPNQTTT